MKTSTEQIKDLVKQISSLADTIHSINWTESEIADPKMGEHLNKLEHYLDCALGRATGMHDRSNALASKFDMAAILDRQS